MKSTEIGAQLSVLLVLGCRRRNDGCSRLSPDTGVERYLAAESREIAGPTGSGRDANHYRHS